MTSQAAFSTPDDNKENIIELTDQRWRDLNSLSIEKTTIRRSPRIHSRRWEHDEINELQEFGFISRNRHSQGERPIRSKLYISEDYNSKKN